MAEVLHDSYYDTGAQKTVITDAIDIIDPRDVPVIKFFGINGDPGKFDIVNWPGTKVYWLEDSLSTITTALDGTWASDWTTLNVTAGTGKYFKPGDLVKVYGAVSGDYETNIVRVSSISTDALTVDPDYDGSNPTGTVAESGATVELVGSARTEGEDADYERSNTSVSSDYNYTQIFQDDLKISRTADKISQYGKGGEWDYQAAKKMPELMRQMARTFYWGVRAEDDTTGAGIRSMGGLHQFISTNSTNLASAALTRKDIHDEMQDCWDEGGNPDLLICNAWVKRKISDMFEGYVRTTRNESTGGVIIDTIATEFGELDILMDRWCPSDRLYLVESQYIGFLAYDPFFWEMLAKTGDAMKGQVVGEYTLVVKNEQAHAMIYGISTSS